MPKLKNIHNNIVLEINLLKNERFDVKVDRDDFENWIPFELGLYIESSEKYIYPKEDGSTFSLEDLKRMALLFESIIKDKSEKKDIKRVQWGPTEYYFAMYLYDTYEENEINIEFWIIVGELTKGKSHGYDRGFQFSVSVEALRNFLRGLQEQLSELLLT